MATVVVGIVVVLAGRGTAQPAEEVVDPVSPSGLDHYAQGGVVVDGIAYFTSDDGGCIPTARTDAYPSVVAFDLSTFRTVRRYPFGKTYDSSPFLFQKRDGTWLVVAHEHKNKRTVAVQRDTGRIAWTGEANQPGAYFFGYSYFGREDGSKLILAACQNGLHAMSGETGEDVWRVQRPGTGGITPCVDQANGWVFYQSAGLVAKIRASDGRLLASTSVEKPNGCISWNTVLVDDDHGYFVATRWYGAPEWDSALRVYDKDLNLLWEHKGLPHGKKATITYAEGKLVVGSGNGWNAQYTGDRWKYLAAYSIADGHVAWKCDLRPFEYKCILNVPYFAGRFFAETQDGKDMTSKVFRINARSGELEDVIEYGCPITSCAACIIAHGMILSGDLHRDRIVATRIAEGSSTDWIGPFGNPQTHQMAASAEGDAQLVPMRELSDDDVKKQGAAEPE
jgi:hypothetical protein